MGQTGLIADDLYLDHLTSDYHPEHPDRLRAIYAMLKEEMGGQAVRVPPREATTEELEWIHTPSYVQRIDSTRGCGHLQLDPDTHVSSETYRVARMAAGGLCALIEALFSGDIQNGFALIRPPGHHAEADRGMGFCIYNNVAIGARYAQHRGLAKRILVVDWDLHHGNGTQHAFETDPSVLYFSTHQFPYYPGTGGLDEVGRGEGKGFTVNVPLPGGQGDADFICIYREILDPIARQFHPDLVLVSAGFDTYYQDPLGGMRVTEEGFGQITRILMGIAEACCEGRILLTLEGGYNLEGLSRGVKRVLQTLMGEELQGHASGPCSATTAKILDRIRATLQPYWKV